MTPLETSRLEAPPSTGDSPGGERVRIVEMRGWYDGAASVGRGAASSRGEGAVDWSRPVLLRLVAMVRPPSVVVPRLVAARAWPTESRQVLESRG